MPKKATKVERSPYVRLATAQMIFYDHFSDQNY